jgi:hypothetical protein
MGVLSALPIVYIGNLCCCLWIITGGVVAAYVFQQETSAPITPSDGALVGLLAGLTGAVVHLVLSVPIDIVMAPFERSLAERLLGAAGSMPSEMRDLIEQGVRSSEAGIGILVIRRIVVFVMMLFIGALFSTLGGMLDALVFKKPAPPGVIDVPPPPAG